MYLLSWELTRGGVGVMGRSGCHGCIVEEESILGVPPTQIPAAMEQLSLVQLGVSIPGF